MGKTILIVEDEQNIVDILSFNLRHTTGPPAYSWPWKMTRT